MTKKATIAGLDKKVNAFYETVNSQVSTIKRSIGGLLGISHDGKRNLYDVYGYLQSIPFEEMYKYSRRQGVANRITWGVPKTCWRDGFDVYEDSSDDAKVVLQDELNKLTKSGVIRKLEQADILNRIGRFSVLFVGVPDGGQPDEPLGTVFNGKKGFLDKIYFTPYAYDGIEITEQEKDPTNPRYGQPKFYTLMRTNFDAESKDTSVKSIRAHWSRVIHLNENALESDIEGMGALEPVFNRILDLDKTCGGSAEAYFRNAKGKLGYEVDKDFAVALQDSKTKNDFQEGIERYTNEMQDFTVAQGAKLKTLPTPHASPVDTVKVSLWEISGYTGIPIRVLTGEGAGQLAGSEDQLALNQLIRDRQRIFCSTVVDRLFSILEVAGMITMPNNYEVRFPVQEASTEKEASAIGDVKAATILKLTQAKGNIGGEGLDLDDAFAACGLSEVGIEEPEIDDLDDEVAAIEEPVTTENIEEPV